MSGIVSLIYTHWSLVAKGLQNLTKARIATMNPVAHRQAVEFSEEEQHFDLSSAEQDRDLMSAQHPSGGYHNEYTVSHGDFPWRSIELFDAQTPA